jgi:hypothetical protein
LIVRFNYQLCARCDKIPVQIKAASRGVVARLKAGLTTTTHEVIVMATPSLSPKLALEIARRQRHAIVTRAIQLAKNAVKHQLQARGIKLASVSARDITLMAEDYLNQHRHELIVEAMTTVQQWTAEGVFGKCATSSQIQWVRLCRTHERNGCSEGTQG